MYYKVRYVFYAIPTVKELQKWGLSAGGALNATEAQVIPGPANRPLVHK